MNREPATEEPRVAGGRLRGGNENGGSRGNSDELFRIADHPDDSAFDPPAQGERSVEPVTIQKPPRKGLAHHRDGLAGLDVASRKRASALERNPHRLEVSGRHGA